VGEAAWARPAQSMNNKATRRGIMGYYGGEISV
jgi:hypothetical protein